ncbi:DUF3606 domain-containing protein [Treponema sp.]|uniref:DUF3606 domain-containing protein n=1 Tax=Treponema sp. TaxID=166 RepID=UPI0025F95210|nr:DUF3606 domain-containing protein [Treponema sp.]MBR4323022.1 DUF3606 domain-containing protein [Treponema sp.]
MPDDLTKKHPQDSSKINLSQQWEIDYWTKILHTTEAKLRIAVSKVGSYVSDVKEYLRNH